MTRLDGDTDLVDLNPLLRKRRQSTCEHPTVLVDETLADLECEECGKQVNPYWFIARIAEDWESDARALREYEAQIKEHEAAAQKQHEQNIASMNYRAERLRLEIETLEAKKCQLMAEQVGGQALGQQVKRWKRPRL